MKKERKTEQPVRGKGRKSEGLRRAAKAQWKKRNLPLASTLEKRLGPATLDAGFAFEMKPDRDDPRQAPTNLEHFLPFPLLHYSPIRVSGRSGKERVNWLQEYSKLY